MSAFNSVANRFRAGADFLSFLFVVAWLFIPVSLTAQATGNESTLTARLINIEAAVHETFRYSVTLYNGASEASLFELKAEAPEGWGVIFRARGSQVTAVNMDGKKSEEISLEIHPVYNAEPAKYKIPVVASAGSTTLQLDLEAVVRGSYGVELTTPTGRLSDHVTEGNQKEIHLVVRNTGSLPLEDITMSAQAPANWDATFEPSKIEHLEPGSTTDVVATLSVPDKTIAGDYVTTFHAKQSNSNAQAAFRVTVRTSLLSGWIGILVILSAIALVVYLIRTYGRR